MIALSQYYYVTGTKGVGKLRQVESVVWRMEVQLRDQARGKDSAVAGLCCDFLVQRE